MITNRRQLGLSKARLTDLAEYIVTLDDRPAGPAADAERSSVESVIRSLRREIAEYENLEGSKPAFIRAPALRDVPSSLIRARIAAGLTQGELADRLGLAESAVQRYEAQAYRGARWERLIEVAEAVGVPIVVGDLESVVEHMPAEGDASSAPRPSAMDSSAAKALGESAGRWLALPVGSQLVVDPPVIGLVAVIQAALELLDETAADIAALAARLGQEPLNNLLVDRHDVDDISYQLRAATFGRAGLVRPVRRRTSMDVIEAVNTIAKLIDLQPSLLQDEVTRDARGRINDLKQELTDIEAHFNELGDTRYLSEFQLAGWINLEDKVRSLNQALTLLDHELYDAELSLKAL